jgi:hypothetical protein
MTGDELLKRYQKFLNFENHIMDNRRIIKDAEILSLYDNGVRDFTPYIIELAEPEGLKVFYHNFRTQQRTITTHFAKANS